MGWCCRNKERTFAEFLVGVSDSLGIIMIKITVIIVVILIPDGHAFHLARRV